MGNSGIKSVKRGSDSQDSKWFSKEAILKMQKAQKEMEWLLDREYNSHSVIEIVGNHYQFSARQRNALVRSTASKKKVKARKAKCICRDLTNIDLVYIDGFNLIITLETAFSGSPIILCSDGAVRDLAGLRGTYRIIDKTYYAMNVLDQEFYDINVSNAVFLLDKGVSNSGRLKKFILECSKTWNTDVEVELMDSVDCFLYDKYGVVTSDSVIIDECRSWYNLGRKIIDDYIPDANIINLVGSSE
ncbi:DUF434 domain-containing protein [Clostridium sp. LBM24168]